MAEDLIQEGLDWLERQRRQHLSRAITYRRNSATVEVMAQVAATRYESEDHDGITIAQSVRDYIVAAEDLVLDGQQTEPERGDEILEDRGEKTLVFTVMDIGDEKHFRPTDPDGNAYRIHTKKTEVLT